MADFFDFDPITGVRHNFAYDEMTGQATIETVQDLEPLLKHTRALANDGGTDRGIRESWWLYAKIPAVVQVALHRKGIDINDPGATKRIVQEINEHYSYLKTTSKNDSGVAPKLFIPNAPTFSQR